MDFVETLSQKIHRVPIPKKPWFSFSRNLIFAAKFQQIQRIPKKSAKQPIFGPNFRQFCDPLKTRAAAGENPEPDAGAAGGAAGLQPQAAVGGHRPIQKLWGDGEAEGCESPREEFWWCLARQGGTIPSRLPGGPGQGRFATEEDDVKVTKASFKFQSLRPKTPARSHCDCRPAEEKANEPPRRFRAKPLKFRFVEWNKKSF